MSPTQQQKRKRSRSSSRTACATALLSAVAFLQCASLTTAQELTVSGEVVVKDMAGSDAVRVAFQDTNFQGLTMSIETSAVKALVPENGDAPTSAPTAAATTEENIAYQKMEGIVDCVNTNSGDDNVVIVAGTIQGTARSEFTEQGSKYFQIGDRFLTAMYGNQVGDDTYQKDEIGEIANLGPAQSVTLEGGGIDNSDCMYFTAADFDLRPVASGHLTVHK